MYSISIQRLAHFCDIIVSYLRPFKLALFKRKLLKAMFDQITKNTLESFLSKICHIFFIFARLIDCQYKCVYYADDGRQD